MAKRIGLALILIVIMFASMIQAFGMKKTYSFSTKDEVLINPYIGYAVMSEREDYAELSSLVFIEVTWKELEPKEGVYDWDSVYKKNHIDKWKKAGKHAVFRFICDDPEEEAHRDIPDWLYEKTKGDGTDYDIEYGKGYSPNYANETFISCHEKVIEEIGRKFSEDDFVSYVELGSLGHWGEWHVYYSAGLDRIPKSAVRSRYVSAYEKAFPGKKLLMRRPFRERPEGAGVYNDMTGDSESTYELLGWLDNGGEFRQAEEEDGLLAAPSIWEYAPVGGEFTSGTPMDRMLSSDLDKTVELLKASHMSFIGPKTPKLDEKKNKYYSEGLSLLKYVGYRYTVPSVETRTGLFGDSLEISLELKNIGVAPGYWDFIPYIYVETSDGSFEKYKIDADLKSLQAGNIITLKQTVSRKKAEGGNVYFGIVDGANEDVFIKLDMDTSCLGGMYYLFHME